MGTRVSVINKCPKINNGVDIHGRYWNVANGVIKTMSWSLLRRPLVGNTVQDCKNCCYFFNPLSIYFISMLMWLWTYDGVGKREIYQKIQFWVRIKFASKMIRLHCHIFMLDRFIRISRFCRIKSTTRQIISTWTSSLLLGIHCCVFQSANWRFALCSLVEIIFFHHDWQEKEKVQTNN